MIRQHERSAVDRAPAYVPPRNLGPSAAAVVALIVVHVFAVVGVIAVVSLIARAFA